MFYFSNKSASISISSSAFKGLDEIGRGCMSGYGGQGASPLIGIELLTFKQLSIALKHSNEQGNVQHSH